MAKNQKPAAPAPQQGQQPAPLPPPSKPPTRAVEAGHAGAKVTVACKLPNGILLRVFTWHDRDVPVMGGGVKTVKEAMSFGEPVMIHGPATPHGEVPKMLIAGGYALTPNVDKDLWLKWLEQNRQSEIVTSRLIFAHDREDGARDQAKDQKDVRSGLEPIDPGTKQVEGRVVSKDPRMPHGTPNVHSAAAADARTA